MLVHNLRIETSPWSTRGRGRHLAEERVCVYGGKGDILTEVYKYSPNLLHDIRQSFQLTNPGQLFSGHFSSELTCKIIHDISKTV